MTKLKDIEALARDYDTAARRAAEIVNPAHTKALEAARALVRELGEEVSQPRAEAALAKLVEDAVDRRAPNREVCTTVLMQYMNTVASKTNAPPSKQGDGVYLWVTFPKYAWDWTWGWNDTQRLKGLDAFVLASRGEIDTGLAEFPRDWASVLDATKLEKLAGLADPEGLAKFKQQEQRRHRELMRADELLAALEAADPALGLVFAGEETTEEEVA